jgi:ABC-type transporter Mla subunit MlaD
MGDEQNGHETSRLDRVEGLMELLINDHLKFNEEHKSLLTSQVLLTDQMGKLVGTMGKLAGTMGTFAGMMEAVEEKLEKLAGITREVAESQKDLSRSQKELSEAQKHTDERMNALIAVVDDLIRNRPN